jgi:hypothetical protein
MRLSKSAVAFIVSTLVGANMPSDLRAEAPEPTP